MQEHNVELVLRREVRKLMGGVCIQSQRSSKTMQSQMRRLRRILKEQATRLAKLEKTTPKQPYISNTLWVDSCPKRKRRRLSRLVKQYRKARKG